MAIPSEFLFFHHCEHVIVLSNGLCDGLSDFVVGDVLGIRNAQKSSVTPHLHALYSSLEICYDNDIRKGMCTAKENWIEDQCQEIENILNKNKKAYQTVKRLTSVEQSNVSTIQGKSGICLTEEQEVLDRWTEYCSDLYNHTPN